MAIRNFTPHDVNVRLENGDTLCFPSEGNARCSTFSQHIGQVEGITVVKNSFGQVDGLPSPNGQDCCIVSFVVLQALAGRRDDLIAPDTSPAGNPIRENGQIVAVRRFQGF